MNKNKKIINSAKRTLSRELSSIKNLKSNGHIHNFDRIFKLKQKQGKQ